MQYAMPVAKNLSYFDALWYHTGVLKARRRTESSWIFQKTPIYN